MYGDVASASRRSSRRRRHTRATGEAGYHDVVQEDALSLYIIRRPIHPLLRESTDPLLLRLRRCAVGLLPSPDRRGDDALCALVFVPVPFLATLGLFDVRRGLLRGLEGAAASMGRLASAT